MKYLLSLLLLFLCIFQIKSDNAGKIKQFAESKVGCGYVWGALGEKMTQNRLKQLIAKFGKSKINESVAKKWIGKNCYDCAGFVAKAFNTIGLRLRTGATGAWKNTNWAEKGDIANLPKNKVCILYKASNGGMGHTGIYLGNGYFVHAKGTAEGVVKESFSQYNHWTHWGIPKGLY